MFSGAGIVLDISHHTVHTHVKRLYIKLNVTDRRELILFIVAQHFVT